MERTAADLFVFIRGDVFHEEVDDARVALQDAEDLQRAVRGLEHGRRRRRGLLRLDRFGREAKVRDELRIQRAAEEEREETTES